MQQQQQSAAAAPQVPLLRLAFDIQSAFTQTEVEANFRATLQRGYTPINDMLDKDSGICSLAGAGPSIAQTWHDMHGDVLAINSAIPYLLEQGVVPKYAMLWDAHVLNERFAVAHPNITYLVASRCHPVVFEKLKHCKVVVWHAAGDHNMLDLVRDLAPEDFPAMVNGGTAGITRGIYLANCLGYREIHLHGADSSYGAEGNTHVRGSVVKEKDTMVAFGTTPPLFFRTTPEWCQQVNEYKIIYAMFTRNDFTKLRVFGTGMLPTLHAILEAKKQQIGEEAFLEMISKEAEDQHEMDRKASDGDPEVMPVDVAPTRDANYSTT